MNFKKQYKDVADSSYWDNFWNNYDIDNAINLIKYYKAYSVLMNHIEKNNHILEAGSGVSQWVHSLHHKGYKITGIDYAKKTVIKINKKYPELDVIYGDIFNLNFIDKSISTYLSWGVMEHYEKGPNKILSECRRVLNDDGKLIITVPYLNILRRIFIDGKSFGKGNFYQYVYNRKYFTRILEKNGFEVIEYKKLNWIKGLKDLIFKGSDSKKKEKNNRTLKETKKHNFLKKILVILLIKLQDFSLLTRISGHMIMFVAKKKF